MKSNTFNYSLLAVGVAAVMGISTGAMAADGVAISSDAAPINNVATASYSVGNVAQPEVKSNKVTVNVSETANFSLVATISETNKDVNANKNQTATPGGTTTFTHALTNTGNVTDTYTVNTTALNDSTITTAVPDYALGTSNAIGYTIVQADDKALTDEQKVALAALSQSITGTLTNGGTIKLPPNLKANLSYAAATPSNSTGNDKGVGTLTATSAFFTTAKAPKPTLVNENQTIVRLPTFKITKTAASNVDLSVATPQIAYTIVVTNVTTDYSAAATDFVIRDVLPVGLSLPNGAASDVTVTGGAGTPTISTISGQRAIDVAVANLPVNESRTITFTVNVDKTKYTTAGSSVTNHVAVYDKFVGSIGPLPAAPIVGTHYDILDSTDNNLDVTRVPVTADQSGGAGVDTPVTTNFSNRAIVLNNPTIKEIAPASGTAGQVTHTTNIVNKGQDIEGTDTNPLTFTIVDGGKNGAVRPVTGPVEIIYTPPGNNPVVVTKTITPVNNVYTINNTSLPGGIAKDGTVAINYNVSSGNVTTPATVDDAATIGSTETTIVTLTAGGNGAPTIAPVTDTTNVKGLTLLKQTALQVGCDGTITAYEGTLGKDLTASFTAAPGDCIYYKITANNTFTSASGTSISNVVLSDLTNQWKPKSTYQSSTASSSTGGANTVSIANPNVAATEAVTTTLGTLVAGASGSLTFAIKVNP